MIYSKKETQTEFTKQLIKIKKTLEQDRQSIRKVILALKDKKEEHYDYICQVLEAYHKKGIILSER